jgi:hypothetical protein
MPTHSRTPLLLRTIWLVTARMPLSTLLVVVTSPAFGMRMLVDCASLPPAPGPPSDSATRDAPKTSLKVRADRFGIGCFSPRRRCGCGRGTARTTSGVGSPCAASADRMQGCLPTRKRCTRRTGTVRSKADPLNPFRQTKFPYQHTGSRCA